jgi:hypothetical protein
MRKKTVEELRAKNRERQARWRERHLAFAKLKERNAARIRRGTMEPLGPATPNLPLTSNVSAPNSGISAPNVTLKAGELHYGLVEGWDRMEPNSGGGRRGVAVALDVPRGKLEEETENERATYAKLAQLQARQAAGGLDAGVEVELVGI